MHIDWWTLALQTINVLILVWILARFFYRPVADIIEKRRAAAAKVLTEASDLKASVEADKAGVAAARAGIDAERGRVLAEARKQAEAERDAMLHKAAEAMAKLRTENEAVLAHDRKMMEQAMIERASALGVEIARTLLERLPRRFAATTFLSALPEQLATLPPSSRERLATCAGTTGLDVITAAPLDGPQQAECQTLIEAALRRKAKLAFRSDPALIAGIEIRSETITLKNNWRDDLSRILQQLGSDDGQRQLS
ncbi:MAG TPA: F0F1 ATP synthase subunit delta [Rhizomicrobium sp.]|nr:F0F1 ATP synthase subunit delta [Rhizomicrobium sp.]